MTTAPIRILRVSTVLGQIYVQDAGPTDGPAALLWPSLFSDGQTSWGTQLAGLHQIGWRTLLVDPPGTGGSPAATRVFTMEECATAALQILDAVKIDRAAFIGLSWGGFVALRVAISDPQRVIALVLSNTTARGSTLFERLRGNLMVGLARIGMPGLGSMIAGAMLSKHTRANNAALATQFITGIKKLDTAGLARAVRSVDVNSTDVVAKLSGITAPTLVIAGAEDTVFPRPHSEELAARIAGAELEVVANVSHLAPAEASARVAELMARFLAKVRA